MIYSNGRWTRATRRQLSRGRAQRHAADPGSSGAGYTVHVSYSVVGSCSRYCFPLYNFSRLRNKCFSKCERVKEVWARGWSGLRNWQRGDKLDVSFHWLTWKRLTPYPCFFIICISENFVLPADQSFHELSPTADDYPNISPNLRFTKTYESNSAHHNTTLCSTITMS